MLSVESYRRGERGQATVFVASMLVVMLLFVAVVANVGQAVNRRIALQMVADTGAYTGASIMATGLNQLALWNAALQYTWALFTIPASPVYTPFQFQRVGLSAVPSGYCKSIEGWIGYWSAVRDGINLVYRVENVGYGLLASSEARSTSDFNAADLFPGERLEYGEFDSLADLRDDPLGAIPPARSALTLDESPLVDDGTPLRAVPVIRRIPGSSLLFVPAERTLNYGCVDNAGWVPYVRWSSRRFVTWYHHSDGVKSFVWIVKAPATRALMFDSFFGGNAIPEMKAAAVAKPTGGSIEEGRREYIVKIMPLATVMAGSRMLRSLLPDWLSALAPSSIGRIADPRYDRGGRIVTH
jgi:hypothetical protein